MAALGVHVLNDTKWHVSTPQDIETTLNTHISQGLSSSEVAIRAEQYGKNTLTEHKKDSALKRFCMQFNQTLVYILLGAVAVTLFLQEWVDAIVIFGVVIINAIIGFVQESKALQAINSLSKGIKTNSTVLRNGTKQVIDAKELVPGDVVILQAGDKIPADLRIIKSKDLQIDEASLTGESVPASKTTDTLPPDCVLGDRRNMGFSSTLATYGTGIGIVTGIGDKTEIGKISDLIATTQTLDTPLTKRIKTFSHQLLIAILVLSGLTLAMGWFHGQSMLDSFMAAVALAVGAIPEGLPAAVTIMLAIGVSRMAKRRAVIRNLPAVETLGSTTVICSDKTGTLTKNEMMVQHLWTAQGAIDVSGSGYNPEGAF